MGAFCAVAALETRYKVKSGRLRDFSEQEYLDCTYDDWDGCRGGWHEKAYEYSKKVDGRLAAEKDYPYKIKMGDCKAKSTPNAAIAVKITGFQRVPAGENSNIAALAEGPLAMAISVTDMF